MKVPWQIMSSGHVRFVEPTLSQFRRGAWKDVEATLELELPRDYKSLIADGPAWTLDDELFIFSPFDRNPHLNLILGAARSSWAAATLRAESPDRVTHPLFPEPGGLLAWGIDGNGNEYLWETHHPADSWTVVISVIGDGYYSYPLGLAEFIERLRAHQIDAPLFSDHEPWPPTGSAFGPRI